MSSKRKHTHLTVRRRYSLASSQTSLFGKEFGIIKAPNPLPNPNDPSLHFIRNVPPLPDAPAESASAESTPGAHPVTYDPKVVYCPHCGGHGHIMQSTRTANAMVKIESIKCPLCLGSGKPVEPCRGGLPHIWLNTSGPTTACGRCNTPALRVKPANPAELIDAAPDQEPSPPQSMFLV